MNSNISTVYQSRLATSWKRYVFAKPGRTHPYGIVYSKRDELNALKDEELMKIYVKMIAE